MTPADLTALWDAARATLTSELDIEMLRLAREGHVNRDAIVDGLSPYCDECGDEDDNPDGVCQFEKPEVWKRREAIGKLAAALKEGGTT